MKHARPDYQVRFDIDPLGKIGEDEPVFLLRAQDILFVPMLKMYVMLTQLMSRDGDIIASTLDHIELAEKWITDNGGKVKFADLPSKYHSPRDDASIIYGEGKTFTCGLCGGLYDSFEDLRYHPCEAEVGGSNNNVES